MVVDLDPGHLADRLHVDPQAAVDHLLVAVLVVQLGVALVGGAQRVGEVGGGGGVDHGEADVLAGRLGRLHQLGDAPHAGGRVDDDLHLLVGELLHRVEGEQDAGGAALLGEAQVALQHGPLDGGRVDGVAVGQQQALAEQLARAPEGVGVVPLLGLVVLDQGELHAVLLLQGRLAVPDRLLAVADDDRRLAQADLGEVAEGEVQDGPLPVDRHQRLRQGVGVRAQPAAGAGCQNEADHAGSPDPSCCAGPSGRALPPAVGRCAAASRRTVRRRRPSGWRADAGEDAGTVSYVMVGDRGDQPERGRGPGGHRAGPREGGVASRCPFSARAHPNRTAAERIPNAPANPAPIPMPGMVREQS